MRFITYLTGFIIFFSTTYVLPTTINGRFVELGVSGSKFNVLLQINTNTGTDDLGGATIVFSFDTNAVKYTSSPIRNLDYVFHKFSGGNYSLASLTRPSKTKIWVNIDLPFINSNNGTIVSASPQWTDVVTIKFDLVDISKPRGLSWFLSSFFWGIYDADNITLWQTGSFEGNFGLSVQVSDGWNTVSVPGINPEGQNVNVWWSGRDPNANVFKVIGGYFPVTNTIPTEGYWMKHIGSRLYDTGDEWPVEGIEVVPHNPINANIGWNLIGVFENVVAASSITTNPPGRISSVYYTYTGSYQVATSLKPGSGYFIKTSGPCQINIPNELLKCDEGTTEYFSDDWGKLTFIDNLNHSISLYLTDKANDLSIYELPPVPLDEIFDVRFESGRIVENINSGSNAILMNGIEYPVKVRVENISINLQDISGTKFDVKLGNDEEITISDGSINKLFIHSEIATLPFEYLLEQNYPNPFNPNTTIAFTIPVESNVNLSLYNVLGELILTLVNEEMKPGRHEYRLNASYLSSGIYIYKIKAGDYISSKKMIVLK